MNQPVPTKPGEAQRRRFLQLRAHFDVRIAAAVHNIELEPGGKWFSSNAVETGATAPDGLQVPAVHDRRGGRGHARRGCGEEAARGRRHVRARRPLVESRRHHEHARHHLRLRGVDLRSRTRSSAPAARGTSSRRWCCAWPTTRRPAPRRWRTSSTNATREAKLKAFAEPDYYKELTKTNEQFLTAIVMVAIIMAVGGVFGVMNTMFASIAARIKEVGVLRILGFKRWQILISFMLESLAIGLVGGIARLRCSARWPTAGKRRARFRGGSGGGKSVTLTMIVDTQILAAGTALHARDGPARRAGPGALGDADGDSGIAAITAARA